MAKNSKIEWTDHTFNPWMGCTKVSAGCTHCYAEREMDHHWHKVQWGPQGTRVRTSEDYWQQPEKWNRAQWWQCKVCGWRWDENAEYPGCAHNVIGWYEQAEQTRQRVFCASLADVFEDRPELMPWRRDLFALIEKTPNLDWLVLTKRPENVMLMVKTLPDNVWLGVSAENQPMADERVPKLLEIPAKVRFVSCGPLLGDVDLTDIQVNGFQIDSLRGQYWNMQPIRPAEKCNKLDWVIAEGESGPKARIMYPQWLRSLRDQCQRTGVPFHFKQWGEWGLWDDSIPWGKYPTINHVWGGIKMVRAGKKRTGRVLDGRTWEEFPNA